MNEESDISSFSSFWLSGRILYAGTEDYLLLAAATLSSHNSLDLKTVDLTGHLAPRAFNPPRASPDNDCIYALGVKIYLSR